MPGIPHAFPSRLEKAGNEVSESRMEPSEKQAAPSTDKLWGDLKNLLDETPFPAKAENADRVDDSAPLRRAETARSDSEKEFDSGELIKTAVEAYQPQKGEQYGDAAESQPDEQTEADQDLSIDANNDSIVDKAKNGPPQVDSLKELLDRLLPDADADSLAKRGEGLSEEEKERVKEETGWSDEIVDALGSIEEYEIYKKAGLVEAEVAGKKCLIRTDINWDQEYVDPFTNKTKTNRDRVKEGLAPLDKNGKPIQLHHIGQHADSPLAELTFEEHRCGGNDTILHDKTKSTEVHGPGNTWDSERQEYWKNRAETEGGVQNE